MLRDHARLSRLRYVGRRGPFAGLRRSVALGQPPACLLARLLSCDVGLGLTHQELALGLAHTARQLRQLVRPEEQHAQADNDEHDRRVDDCEIEMRLKKRGHGHGNSYRSTVSAFAKAANEAFAGVSASGARQSSARWDSRRTISRAASRAPQARMASMTR